MASRPIYIPSVNTESLIDAKEIEFKWFPGLSISQKQKSINSLHIAAKDQLDLKNILEISSKSESRSLKLKNRRLSDELNDLRNVAIDEGIYDNDDGED